MCLFFVQAETSSYGLGNEKFTDVSLSLIVSKKVMKKIWGKRKKQAQGAELLKVKPSPEINCKQKERRQ